MTQSIKVGIIGVSGYTGLELLKLLLSHPIFELCYVANTQGQAVIKDIHQMLYKTRFADLNVQVASAKIAAEQCEVIFLALPHKSAMEMTREILAYAAQVGKSIKIIDLSADYRLSAKHYEANYCPHIDKENLAHAIYGLPEYNRALIKNAALVANPGCYPTATLLGLLPFVPYINAREHVFIDAKSGVSGAGRSFSQNTHFSHINENLFSYSPLAHRHQIEIIEKCHTIGKAALKIHFVPHLLPITRGMLVSVFATLHKPLSQQEAQQILYEAYKNEPFVRICAQPVSIAHTAGSHFCDIFVATQDNALFISSSIDNLLRGASSQALMNANIMCGLDEGLGIPHIPYGLF
ncbi:N-acetyl-gamma-glutamyl-phosphate reductase [Helicobacter jaachi]|uniref:N-acetyl-gamma-glutamyl-phosphate reductase n=1 Tax=Helicobacter jaachi TaxID=1677920 RepID=A0A4U8TBQ3_9HELI|nr:N-acetyl-gamma-glutamyl-phosphate reductase [Helicobacter jaachi]TLD97341.1 N-acetyl-gamma-glutamyl-phosphate reductase [Helicobacter jaachi]